MTFLTRSGLRVFTIYLKEGINPWKNLNTLPGDQN